MLCLNRNTAAIVAASIIIRIRFGPAGYPYFSKGIGDNRDTGLSYDELGRKLNAQRDFATYYIGKRAGYISGVRGVQ